MAASCYQIGAIRPDEYERCIDLVARAFTTNNPSTVHTEISFETFRAFALEDCTRAACVDTGLSLAARDSATGQVLAVMFLKTFALHQPPEKMFAESSGLAVSKEMYEALYEDAAVNPFGLCLGSMTSGKTLHGGLGGTAPDAGRSGMGKALRVRAVAVARERGYNTFVVEPFHPATRHIWTKHCGCSVMAERPMDTFVSASKVRGKHPYKGVGGSGAIVELVLNRDPRDWPVFWPLNLLRLLWQAEAFGNLWPAIKGVLGWTPS